MSEKITEINAEQFEVTVLKDHLAVVDFYSTECPPCETLATKFEPLSEIYGEDVKFYKIFRQGNREFAKSIGVSGSPSLLFFKDGKQVGPRLAGGILRSEIMRNLDINLSPERVEELHSNVRPVETKTDVVIFGGGPAGLTAGIYLAQAHIDTIIIDTSMPGGYVSTTHQVSNFPGFIEPINGYELSHRMSEQAKANGVKFRSAVEIDRIDIENKTVRVDGFETISARKMIIATGSKPRPLGVTGEAEYLGHGISYCATCDAKYYDNKDVIVIGGGNSAIEESLLIAKFARSVTIVHRSETLRANREAQAKTAGEPKISFLLNQEIGEIKKYDAFKMGVVVRDKKTGTEKELPTAGVFIFIGFIPNVEMFGDVLVTDQWGYIASDVEMRTNVPGVYSAGDVNSKRYRQITTAVSDGTIAAIGITKELE